MCVCMCDCVCVCVCVCVQMPFNPSKWVHLKNLNRLFSVPISYHMGDHMHTIQKSSSATYLGVTIDHNANWKEHI